MSRDEAIRLDKLRSEAHERAQSQTPFGIFCWVGAKFIAMPWLVGFMIYVGFGDLLHPAWMRIFGWLTVLLGGYGLIGLLWQWIRER